VQEGLSSLVLAARLNEGVQNSCFNGKLEQVRLANDSDETIAQWQFQNGAADAGGYNDEFFDSGVLHLNGRFHNCPVRATKGYRWDASVHDYRHNPEHYAAVHFHDDDMTDARWTPTMTWTVPDELRSGQYALKLIQGQDVDYIPFFLRAAPHHKKSHVAYLAPTATYLAYANQRLAFSGEFASMVKNENDAYLKDHIEVGLSLYEHHSDGSGVHYSSYLRPVLNLKPRGTMWAFNADTNITAWLNHLEIPFDVITDEDLQREGAELLSEYNVVVTGTHPEYYSANMLDGVEGYLEQGGRMMYMGGNGFYWKIAYHPDNPAIIEVRRAEDGTRAWMAESGDYHHSFDGELGGLWRRNGRPPNQIVGIGFAAQGFDGATHYRVTESAKNSRAAFIFEGTSGNEVIGNYGSVEGGAAGQEIDRWDPDLGSPEHAIVLASSENHKPGMLRVVEELSMSVVFLQGSKVRADMTFFETPAGGAVFSTGSITYSGSLAHDGYNNDICRITTNVLRRFSDPTLFDYP
jgi:N,N-dimethylformamidase